MKRYDLPPVPQLTLARKKSQVPTTDTGKIERNTPSQAYTYVAPEVTSASRLTINSISRVSSQSQSRVSTSSISRDAYMIEPSSSQKLSVSRSQSRISNLPSQQSFQYSNPSSSYTPSLNSQNQNYSPYFPAQQNIYVPGLLNSVTKTREQMEFQIRTNILIKDIDAKQLLFRERIGRLTERAGELDRELEMIRGEESDLEKSVIELDWLKNQSIQLGKSYVFQMDKLLNAC